MSEARKPGLVLTRRLGDSIMIGNSVMVTIEDIRGGNIRINIQAPAELSVHRKEVWEKIQRDGKRGDSLGGGVS